MADNNLFQGASARENLQRLALEVAAFQSPTAKSSEARVQAQVDALRAAADNLEGPAREAATRLIEPLLVFLRGETEKLRQQAETLSTYHQELSGLIVAIAQELADAGLLPGPGQSETLDDLIDQRASLLPLARQEAQEGEPVRR